jgi:hypothetical protein
MARRRGVRRKYQRFEIEWYGDEFIAIVREHGPEALFEAAKVVLAEASRRAPRRTGKLAASGYIGVKGQSTYKKRRYWRRERFAKDGEAVIGFSAPHAHLIESGRRQRGIIRPRGDVTRDGVLRRSGKRALTIEGNLRSRSRYNRMSSRPFLGPALEASRERVPRELARVYGNWLDRLLGE